jgi:uncharacterized SAM-binding protein YcdF (DUF218 family)
LTGLVIAGLAALAVFLYLGWRINRTGASDQAQPADAIVILGAQVEPDGQPGPDLRVRTLHAVALYQQGLAPYVVCTGGVRGERLSAAAVACRFAVRQGVPPDRALIADGSMTTREDAARAAELAAAYGWKSAILVSHPLHLERARRLFRGQSIAVYPSPTSTNLAAIPWSTRVYLTAREAVGIVWIGLEKVGVPGLREWTRELSRWVYGTAAIVPSVSHRPPREAGVGVRVGPDF